MTCSSIGDTSVKRVGEPRRRPPIRWSVETSTPSTTARSSVGTSRWFVSERYGWSRGRVNRSSWPPSLSPAQSPDERPPDPVDGVGEQDQAQDRLDLLFIEARPLRDRLGDRASDRSTPTGESRLADLDDGAVLLSVICHGSAVPRRR